MRYIVGVDIGGTFTDCVALKSSDDGTAPVVMIVFIGSPALVRRWHPSFKA